MTSYFDTLASYVPPLVIRRLAQSQGQADQPQTEVFQAAVLFADISGFTQLTETLSLRGEAGTEALSDLLNAYFGQLIDLITQHGGEVVKFAGDALLALWPTTKEALPTAVALATQCALTIQTQASQRPISTPNPLLLRLGVSAGNITQMVLGGVFKRWELLVAGHPVVEANDAQKQALPGQAVLCSYSWELVQDRCTGVPLPDGRSVLVNVHTPHPLPAPRPLPLGPEVAEFLKPYIPGAIRGRLEAGQLSWLAELRRLTILFVNLPTLTHQTPLTEAQAVMEDLQKAIYRYEGSVNKLSVDDKGVTLVAIMGLPPFSHEDDPLRGVQAALALQEALRRAGWAFTIGITTGRAFCGSIGNDTRREYTVLGDVVNVAARLMQTAVTVQTFILCDETTYEATQNHITYRLLPPVMVKGKAEPVAIYHPLAAARSQLRTQSRLVGRMMERIIIGDGLQALALGQNQLLVIEGEAGIGKSKLAEEAMSQAQQKKIRVLFGAGDAIDKSTPYHAWRTVFAQLFEIDLFNDPPSQQKAQVLARLKSQFPDLLPLSPLLNVVLPLDLADNELTSQMRGEVHRANTQNLLTRLLQETAVTQPILLILEDAHWLDSASWSLAQIVHRDVHPLFLLLATRPIPLPIPPEYQAFQVESQSQDRFLILTTLEPQQIEALVSYRLGVTTLPPTVARFIHQKAEGHPFFSEELAYALRDAGFLQVVDGECVLTEQAGDLSHLNFPDTIQGIVTSRIDRLAPQQVLALKVASVIGRVFAYRVLQDIYPIADDKPHLFNYLNHLQELDITPLETPDPDLAYIFKHIITQEVAYNLMSFAQRQQLHHAIAQWYEQTYQSDLSPYYPILAYHWQSAQTTDKALIYLEKAGEQALRNHANQEAARFFAEALHLVNEQNIPLEPFQKARWHRQLGAAYYELGQLKASRENLLEAGALLGIGQPASRRQLIRRLLGQAGRQFWHRWRSVSPVPAAEVPPVLEAARNAALLGEVLYFTAETFLAMMYSMSSLNLAEKVGVSPELARCYANTCIAASIVPVHRWAKLYGRLAVDTARKTGELVSLSHALNCAAIYWLGVGNWQECERLFDEAGETAHKINDPRQWITSRVCLGLAYHYQGRFADAIHLNQVGYEAAVRSGNLVQQGWGLYSQAENHVRTREWDLALGFLARAEIVVAGDTKRLSHIRVESMWALAYLGQGDMVQARHKADKAASLIAEVVPNVYSCLEAYSAPAEVYLALWEQATAEAERQELQKAARQSTQVMRRFSRLFPVGQARTFLYEGGCAWLENNPAKAYRFWQQGVTWAQKMAMPCEEAMLLARLGRSLPATDPQQVAYLRRAEALWQAAGVH